MDESKFKTDQKEKLARLAGDLQKVLGVRTPPAAVPPSKGEERPKKPAGQK